MAGVDLHRHDDPDAGASAGTHCCTSWKRGVRRTDDRFKSLARLRGETGGWQPRVVCARCNSLSRLTASRNRICRRSPRDNRMHPPLPLSSLPPIPGDLGLQYHQSRHFSDQRSEPRLVQVREPPPAVLALPRSVLERDTEHSVGLECPSETPQHRGQLRDRHMPQAGAGPDAVGAAFPVDFPEALESSSSWEFCPAFRTHQRDQLLLHPGLIIPAPASRSSLSPRRPSTEGAAHDRCGDAGTAGAWVLRRALSHPGTRRRTRPSARRCDHCLPHPRGGSSGLIPGG
jgi:hypothetical protein